MNIIIIIIIIIMFRNIIAVNTLKVTLIFGIRINFIMVLLILILFPTRLYSIPLEFLPELHFQSTFFTQKNIMII